MFVVVLIFLLFNYKYSTKILKVFQLSMISVKIFSPICFNEIVSPNRFGGLCVNELYVIRYNIVNLMIFICKNVYNKIQSTIFTFIFHSPNII